MRPSIEFSMGFALVLYKKWNFVEFVEYKRKKVAIRLEFSWLSL
jgi:hypothetical protein